MAFTVSSVASAQAIRQGVEMVIEFRLPDLAQAKLGGHDGDQVTVVGSAMLGVTEGSVTASLLHNLFQVSRVILNFSSRTDTPLCFHHAAAHRQRSAVKGSHHESCEEMP